MCRPVSRERSFDHNIDRLTTTEQNILDVHEILSGQYDHYFKIYGCDASFAFNRPGIGDLSKLGKEKAQVVLRGLKKHSMYSNLSLSDTHVFRLEPYRFCCEDMHVFSCQQDIPPGVSFSGQYFGPNIEAFQGFLHSLIVDTDLFSCFNISGLQGDCPCINYFKKRSHLQKFIARDKFLILFFKSVILNWPFLLGHIRSPRSWVCCCGWRVLFGGICDNDGISASPFTIKRNHQKEYSWRRQ